MSKTIITSETIRQRKELSTSIKLIKIDQYILDVELLDIKPLLGRAFFHELKNNLKDERFLKLVKGSEFQSGDYSYSHIGLGAVMVEFAMARYNFFGSETPTAFGLVDKQYQDGKHATRDRKKELYTEARKNAYEYWEDVKFYLECNSDLFPIFARGCENEPNRARGLRITHVR